MRDTSASPVVDKTLLRQRAKKVRHKAHHALAVFATTAVTEIFFEHFDLPAGTTVAGYWPTGSEVDIRILLNQLNDNGYRIALPCMDTANSPLTFRIWKAGTPLVNGRHNIMEPPPENPIVQPSVILVPLLAFDTQGVRLGMGGGYYDRTLARLKETSEFPVQVIGIAYSTQKLPAIPAEPHDIPLDWIVTETYAHQLNKST